jgi:hypothetical protein
MGCMYAEGPLDKCLCACGGVTHGLMTENVAPRVSCSPAAASRCQNGEEGRECHCACAGANHSLYKNIPQFDEIRITGYTNYINA